MSPDPSLALQQAVRRRLVAFNDLTALVPPSTIFDRMRRPEGVSCIVMGDGQTVPDDAFMARNVVRVFLDLHVWVKADALEPVKAIAGGIAAALRGPAPALDAGRCIDFKLGTTRFMHDPGNEWGHGIVAVEALVELAL